MFRTLPAGSGYKSMNEQGKPFDTVSIMFLLMVSVISDIADLFTDFIFPVPVIGQIIFLGNSFLISPIIWAIIQFSFIMKTGASKTALIPVIGGLGNIANIPGSETVTTVIAITMANRSALAGIAAAPAAKIAGAAREATVATKAAGGAAVAEKGGAATERAASAERGAFAEAEEAGAPAEIPEAVPEKEISPEALGEEPEPMEKLQSRLLEETPAAVNDEEGVYVDGDEVDLRKAA